MKTKLVILSFLVLASLLLAPASFAQCYLSSQCRPVDSLTYIPNGTGQVYHGDGASNNGVGGWTTAYADANQCLSCHYGTDTLPYLQTGHKNILRKYAPGVLWGGPDSALYAIFDGFYGSGTAYDWNNGQVTVGWCTPLATLLQNGSLPSMPPANIRTTRFPTKTPRRLILRSPLPSLPAACGICITCLAAG